jgi:lactoylglutathione lyase
LASPVRLGVDECCILNVSTVTMETIRAIFKNAWPYQRDKMNLPVGNLSSSLPFYQRVFDFTLVSQKNSPFPSAILERDNVQIGLSENGGDPSQDGCFFEVDRVTAALEELKAKGLTKEISQLSEEKHGDTSWKLFYVIAPDGLCYCIGERI